LKNPIVIVEGFR